MWGTWMWYVRADTSGDAVPLRAAVDCAEAAGLHRVHLVGLTPSSSTCPLGRVV